jgi:hypothetical protein
VRRALVAAGALAVLAVAAVFLMRTPPPAAAPVPGPPPAAPAPPRAAAAALPSRNVFAYADEAPAALEPDAGADLPEMPAVGAAAPDPGPAAEVRLVGLVRRAGRVKAAVWIRGEIVVLGPGESAENYTVVSVTEDAGVRLRWPDGSERVLEPPAS